jgi:phage shock protein PspC (stress-responsive transcriptional regulator)
MDKTIKINLAGTLFQIEEDAYHMLRNYLQAINSRFQNIPGGNETIEDIESRIAEIFQSQKNTAGVISKPEVEAMIGILGKPEDFEVPEQQNQSTFSGPVRRRLYRNPDDTVFSGVCGGIGAYLNSDPVWIRVAFILTSLFFGIGFFVYLALWIAVPSARSEYQKRELHGENYHRRNSAGINTNISGGPGGAINEIFGAIGKFFYIVFRIIMILFGILFLAFGLSALLAVFLVYFFKNPEFISMGSLNSNLFFMHDFLNFIVDPSISMWIIVLSFIAFILPLCAIIYWGIKMIFWFRVRDGIPSLVFFVTWVASLTALTVILVNTGVSFSKYGESTSQEILQNKRDTLFIITDRKVKDLHTRKEFKLPENEYSMFISDPDSRLCIRPRLRLYITADKASKIEISKGSMAISRIDAVNKAESLKYDYRFTRDTLYLDEYFTLPEGRKWAADKTVIRLYIPEKTVIYFDNECENLFPDRVSIIRINKDMEYETDFTNNTRPWELGGNFWIIREDGLEKTTVHHQGKM